MNTTSWFQRCLRCTYFNLFYRGHCAKAAMAWAPFLVLKRFVEFVVVGYIQGHDD